jgi:hypothetical protein
MSGPGCSVFEAAVALGNLKTLRRVRQHRRDSNMPDVRLGSRVFVRVETPSPMTGGELTALKETGWSRNRQNHRSELARGLWETTQLYVRLPNWR